MSNRLVVQGARRHHSPDASVVLSRESPIAFMQNSGSENPTETR